MLSDKTTYYRISATPEELREQLGAHNELAVTLPFGEVLIKEHQENFVAFRNECPHQKLKLNNCRIKDNHVVCPWHQYAFHVEHGKGQGLYLPIYPIIVKEDGLYLSRTYFSWFGE